MKPFIISITGAHSGCGKTRVAEKIIRGIKAGWGAVKYTGTALYASLTDDDEAIDEAGKDTRRLRDAGADPVVWVRSPHEGLGEVLEMAMERVQHCTAVVVEGNGPAMLLHPDLILFVLGDDPGNVKDSAVPLMEKANFIIYKEKPFIKTSAKMYNKYSGPALEEMVREIKTQMNERA